MRPTTSLYEVSGRTRLDFTAEELLYLIDLGAELKAAKRSGSEQPRLAGRNIALIFEKTSTRSAMMRCRAESKPVSLNERSTP